MFMLLQNLSVSNTNLCLIKYKRLKTHQLDRHRGSEKQGKHLHELVIEQKCKAKLGPRVVSSGTRY